MGGGNYLAINSGMVVGAWYGVAVSLKTHCLLRVACDIFKPISGKENNLGFPRQS
jgi:hypothetical protein